MLRFGNHILALITMGSWVKLEASAIDSSRNGTLMQPDRKYLTLKGILASLEGLQ